MWWRAAYQFWGLVFRELVRRDGFDDGAVTVVLAHQVKYLTRNVFNRIPVRPGLFCGLHRKCRLINITKIYCSTNSASRDILKNVPTVFVHKMVVIWVKTTLDLPFPFNVWTKEKHIFFFCVPQNDISVSKWQKLFFKYSKWCPASLN